MISFQIWCLLQVSKKLGRGYVYHGVASPLLFKTAWISLGIEVMSFWSFVFRIWSHSCLIQVYSCWRVHGRLWHIFCIMIHQMFTIREISGLQAGQFSTRSLILWSHAVAIAAVCGFALSCWNTQGLPWYRRRPEGSICCSITFIYFSAFIEPSKTCKLPVACTLMLPHTIRDAAFWPACWWHTGRSPSSLARRTRRLWFPTRM